MRIRRTFATIVLMAAPHILMSQVRALQSGRAGATLATLGAMTVTPMATFGTRSYVARTVTLTAAVTNPDAMGTTGWCEMTSDNRGWTKNGGTYAGGKCTFGSVPLPLVRGALSLNLRACNAAGCKESPTVVSALVDAVAPTVTTPLSRADLGPGGATIAFSELLPGDQQQRIEAAISTVASHPVKFAWSEQLGPQGGSSHVVIQSLSTPAVLRQSVTLDLADGVGNVTRGAKLVDIPVQSVVLPDLAAAVVTPSATLAGRTFVARVVSLTAAVSNPAALEKDGWCEMTFAQRGGWTKNGGTFAKGTCTFAQVQLPLGRAPVELNVRGCNPSGCKESPVWTTAMVDALPPTVVTPFTRGMLGPAAETIVFSEPLPSDQKQRIEAAVSASADHPVTFAWAEQPGPAGIGEKLELRPATVGVRFRQSVTVDLTDLVGNVTQGAKVLDVATVSAELPNPGAVAVTPMAVVGGHMMVARSVSLTATVSNPSAMGKDGWCEMAARRADWHKEGGAYIGGMCKFAQIALPGIRRGATYEFNIRACASAGCKESPAWLTAELDDAPPTVVAPLTRRDIGPGTAIGFSEPLPPEQQQRVEAAISAVADHPLKFAWSEQRGPMGSTSQVMIHSVATPALLRQSVSLDLSDAVGNVTHDARIIALP